MNTDVPIDSLLYFSALIFGFSMFRQYPPKYLSSCFLFYSFAFDHIFKNFFNPCIFLKVKSSVSQAIVPIFSFLFIFLFFNHRGVPRSLHKVNGFSIIHRLFVFLLFPGLLWFRRLSENRRELLKCAKIVRNTRQWHILVYTRTARHCKKRSPRRKKEQICNIMSILTKPMGKDVLSYTRPVLYTLDVCPGVSKKLEHLPALRRVGERNE